MELRLLGALPSLPSLPGGGGLALPPRARSTREDLAARKASDSPPLSSPPVRSQSHTALSPCALPSHLARRQIPTLPTRCYHTLQHTFLHTPAAIWRFVTARATGRHTLQHTFLHTRSSTHVPPHTFLHTLSSTHVPPHIFLHFPPLTFLHTLSSIHFPPHTFLQTLSSTHFPPHTFLHTFSSTHFSPHIFLTFSSTH
jgi:hypothetical protein